MRTCASILPLFDPYAALVNSALRAASSSPSVWRLRSVCTRSRSARLPPWRSDVPLPLQPRGHSVTDCLGW